MSCVRKGYQVKIMSGSFIGQVGVVTDINTNLCTFKQQCDVELPSGRTVLCIPIDSVVVVSTHCSSSVKKRIAQYDKLNRILNII